MSHIRLSAVRTRRHSLIVRRSALFCACVSVLSGTAVAEPSPPPEVPAGYCVELAAGPPQVKYPMFAVFDERGRLFVAESSGLDLYEELAAQTRKCRVRLLEDQDGDGRFETSRVFADKLVFPMGLSWRGGKLYVADPPDLVSFEDSDGDGTADKRTVILTGFGHRDNGSLHGLIFGPDGWLYMTMGSPDGYHLERADGSVIEGESGALIRCRPDGSDPQVLCRGFENLVEVVFTPRGDVIGTDNWFRDVNEQGSGGLRDALVHLLEGGLYPYHREVGTPQPITGERLGPVAMFPAVALSGLVRYEGPMFPDECRGNLFSAQHNTRKVGRHVLVPDGSTFRSHDFDFLTCEDPDFRPSDVLEAGDGSLLVVDTGSWYIQHCPTGRLRERDSPGGIYRVRREGFARPNDPWGNRVDWDEASVAELIMLAGDERPPVRQRAHLALAARGEAAVPPLAAALEQSSVATTKQRIIWTLAVIGSDSARQALRTALAEGHDVAATAARALAALEDREAAAALGRLLSREAPHVRLAAAEALAHCGSRDSLPRIWRALAGEPDRFLQHALIHAAHRLANVDDLQTALRSGHPRVQQAALLLLNQPPRPPGSVSRESVLARVSSTDGELRRTAIRILEQHPEWTDAAVDIVRSWLKGPIHPGGESTAEEERQLQDLTLALQAEPPMQELIAAALVDRSGKVSEERQVELLQMLTQTSPPAPPDSWTQAIESAIEEGSTAVRVEAVRTGAVWQIADLDAPLVRVAESEIERPAVRMDAVSAVVARNSSFSPSIFEMLERQLTQEADPLARLRAAEIIGRGRLTDPQLTSILRSVQGDALISPEALLPAIKNSVNADTPSAVLDYLEASLQHGWRPSKAHLLDIVESLSGIGPRANGLFEMVEQNLVSERASLASYEPLLHGGDAGRGREVFFSSKVACGSCHRVGWQGGSVGPDLTRIGSVRSPRDLLESIVFPSSSFAQGYDNYFVTTVEGRTTTGTIAQQFADVLLLRDSSGALHRVVRDDIEALDRLSVSLMPEGLPRAMSRQDFRDLLAFLQTLK